MLDFGVSFMADPPVSDIVGRTVLAEQNGFSHAWMWDSHVLWQEVYPIFTLMAAGTTTIHIGPCVTNPVTRDPDRDRGGDGHAERDLRRPDGDGRSAAATRRSGCSAASR